MCLQSGSLAGLVRRLLLLECTKQRATQPDTPSPAAAAAGSNVFHPKLQRAWQQQQLLDLQQIALTCPGSSSSSNACDGLHEWGQKWHPQLLNVLLWQVHNTGLGGVLLTELEKQLNSSATGCCTAQHSSSAAGSPLAAAAAADTAAFRTGGSSSSRLTNDFVEFPDQQDVLSSNQHSKLSASSSGKNSKNSSSREHHKQPHGSSTAARGVASHAAHAYVRSCMGLLSRAALSSWVLSWHTYMAEGGGDYCNSSKR
jgi:hypothetical protein